MPTLTRSCCGCFKTRCRETVEAALAHAIGDATERAYRRGDALAKRRELRPSGTVICRGAPALM
jgi:hypothetical protein